MHPNPRKTTSLHHLGKVDIAQLREAVLAIPESVWDAEDQSKPNRRYQQVAGGAWVPVPGRVFATTRHIVFRFVTSHQAGANPQIGRCGPNGGNSCCR